MKILVLNAHGRRIGGVETYLAGLLPGLEERGHEVGWVHRGDVETQRPWVIEDVGIRSWSLQDTSFHESLAAIRSWKPDIVYSHFIGRPDWELQLTSLAPTTAFVHDYSGLCLTGMRHHGRPSPRPCHRDFGLACLLCHPVLRCGGCNFLRVPFLYLEHQRRLKLLQRHTRVLSHTAGMLDLLHRHGVAREKLRKITHFVPAPAMAPPVPEPLHPTRTHYSLLFSGRLEPGKGLLLLPPFLTSLVPLLDRPVELVLMGAGRLEPVLRKSLDELETRLPGFSCRWAGWVDARQRDELYASSDLLVLPSTWPEPFGQVGVEAARMGLPCVAFKVGGIPEWLEDGVQGRLVDSPTCRPEDLARGALDCLRDPERHLSMRKAALKLEEGFQLEEHLNQLEVIFQELQVSHSSSTP